MNLKLKAQEIWADSRGDFFGNILAQGVLAIGSIVLSCCALLYAPFREKVWSVGTLVLAPISIPALVVVIPWALLFLVFLRFLREKRRIQEQKAIIHQRQGFTSNDFVAEIKANLLERYQAGGRPDSF